MKAFRWNFSQLDARYINRVLADYLAYSGYFESAKALIKHEGLEDFVDVAVYEELFWYLDSLQESDLDALEWCTKHRSALKKRKSRLEPALHLQHFLQLVEAGKVKEAYQYMQKAITQIGIEGFPDIRKALTLPAFACPPKEYADLLSDQRKENRALFSENFCALYGIPSRPLLEVLMESGFIALLSPSCGESPCASCPKNAGY